MVNSGIRDNAAMRPGNGLPNVRKVRPLVCHITNFVTADDCALTAACLGCHPIIVDSEEEAEEIVSKSSSLVLNIGTLNERVLDLMIAAGKSANRSDIPIVFDPVGVGATEYRLKAAERILSEIEVDVVKGNAGEISVLAGMSGEVKGVDSLSESSPEAAARLAKEIGAIVGLSGSVDCISDGETTYCLEGGREMMGRIPGTGCMLSTAVGCFVGSCGPELEAVTDAFSVFSAASEMVPCDAGIGSFKAQFFDVLSVITEKDVEERCTVAKR